MATTPTFAATPNVGMKQIAVATTARDTYTPISGDLVFTAGASGSRIDRVDVVSAALVGGGAPSANVVRLWLYDGTDVRLLREIEVPSTTPTASAKGFAASVEFPTGRIVPAGCTVRATLHTYAGAQDKYNVIVQGANY
jgi:hypothetical protein